jgi:hypothetical protein
MGRATNAGEADAGGNSVNPGGAADAGCELDPSLSARRLVLFGGLDNATNTFLGDTWEWDGNAWMRSPASGPTARSDHAMATLHGKVVLFGGGVVSAQGATVLSGHPLQADTWEWDGVTWTQRLVPGPSARAGHAMATLNGKIVLFGGGVPGMQGVPGATVPDESLSPPETWEWDGNAWALRATSGPPPRMYHTMTTIDGKVVLYGGTTSGGVESGDVWEWDGNAWMQRVVYGTMGNRPNARTEHAMAALCGKLVLFGGANHSSNTLGDTWELDMALWAPQTAPGPSARYEPAMATLRDKVFLFGGAADSVGSAAGETWEWDGNTWTQHDSPSPSPRSGHAMAAR